MGICVEVDEGDRLVDGNQCPVGEIAGSRLYRGIANSPADEVFIHAQIAQIGEDDSEYRLHSTRTTTTIDFVVRE
jgi:hypothetical protein